MIPRILLTVLQAGAKSFLDLDPTVTEHFARQLALQAAAVTHGCNAFLLHTESRLTARLVPLSDALRNVRMHVIEA